MTRPLPDTTVYDFIERHLIEAGSHMAMVQLMNEYRGDTAAMMSDGLQNEILDQANQLMAFIAENWDAAWGWSQAYYETMDEFNEEWDTGGLDWAEDEDE